MEHVFVRITLNYDELRGIIATWSQYCEKIAVVEHEGEKTEKIHVHILMYNMARTWQRMKQIAERDFNSVWSQVRGNEMISKKKAYNYDAMATIRYMLKGKYDLSYNKGYDDEFIRDAKASWKPPADVKTKLQAQLERFATYVYEEGYIYSELQFETCKRLACRFAYKEYYDTFPMPQAMILVKSLVYSTKFDVGFEIDEKSKWAI